jgi:hypothetical protein
MGVSLWAVLSAVSFADWRLWGKEALSAPQKDAASITNAAPHQSEAAVRS